MRMLRPLLGALAALFSADPELHLQRRRHRAAPTAVDKAHRRAADRKWKRDRLARNQVWGFLSDDEELRLAQLRRQRGKVARRMARRPRKREKRTIPPATKPLHLGDRIPKSARLLLLRQEGRPLSGRQWRQLRKAARRQERAA